MHLLVRMKTLIALSSGLLLLTNCAEFDAEFDESNGNGDQQIAKVDIHVVSAELEDITLFDPSTKVVVYEDVGCWYNIGETSVFKNSLMPLWAEEALSNVRYTDNLTFKIIKDGMTDSIITECVLNLGNSRGKQTFDCGGGNVLTIRITEADDQTVPHELKSYNEVDNSGGSCS